MPSPTGFTPVHLDCRTPPVTVLQAWCDGLADEIARRYRAGRTCRIVRQLVHALALAQRVGPLSGSLGCWRARDVVWLLDRWLPEHLRVPDDLVSEVPALLVAVFGQLHDKGLLENQGLDLEDLSSVITDRADLLRRRLRRANSARRALPPLRHPAPATAPATAPAASARTGT